MTYKEYRNTYQYKQADVVELYSAETGFEIDDNIPEEELNEMEVVHTSGCGTWLSITLARL